MLVTAGAGTALAAPGYLPPPVPTPPGTPGGFTNVLTTVSAGGGGGVIGPVQSRRLRVTVRVARGTFPVGATITLTAPNLLGLGSVRGFPGYRVVGGIGVLTGVFGAKINATFIHPLTLHIASSSITPSSIVIIWTGTRWIRVPGAVILRGGITLLIHRDAAFLVLNPVGSGAGTGPVTGVGGRGHGRHHHHGRHHGRHRGRHKHGWVPGMRYGAALHGQHAALTSAALAADSSGTGRSNVAGIAALAAGLLVAAAGGLTYLIRRRSGARW